MEELQARLAAEQERARDIDQRYAALQANSKEDLVSLLLPSFSSAKSVSPDS